MSGAANLPVTPPSYLDGNKCLRDLCADDNHTPQIAEVPLKDWPNLPILANAAYHSEKTAAHAHRKLLYAFFKASESENTALAQYALDIHRALSGKASKRAFTDIYNKKSLEEKKEERAERRARKKRKMDEAEAVESAVSAAVVTSLKIAEGRLRQLANEAPSEDQDLPAPQEYTVCEPSPIMKVVKENALQLFTQWKNGKALTSDEVGLMKCGLSSILDLIERGDKGQKRYFMTDWDTIVSKFENKYVSSKYAVPKLLDQTWKIISKLAAKHNDLELATEYLDEVRRKTPYGSTERKELKLAAIMLDVLENHSADLLADSPDVAVTEGDYLAKVWSPLLDALFNISGVVRTKVGESVNAHSSRGKQHMYTEQTNGKAIIGFKIDFRLVCDKDDVEYDVGAGELANVQSASRSKIISDEKKLLRESKDVLDGLVMLNSSHARELSSWMIQLNGPDGMTGSVHLYKSGFYVALPRSTFSLPKCFADLDKFSTVLEALFDLKHNVEKASLYVKQALRVQSDHTNTFDKYLNLATDDENSQQNRATWCRGTFYTPPPECSPTIPFGFTECAPSSSQQSSQEQEEVPDQFGWVKAGDQWKNVYTNETVPERPY